MKPAIRAIAAILLAAILAIGATAAPAAGTYLLEIRGEATADRTLERLGLPSTSDFYRDDETALRDFFFSRDVSSLSPGCFNGGSAIVSTLSPADCNALFSLYDAEGWSREPDTPEGVQAFVPPSRSHTNYLATVGGKTVEAESLSALQAAIDVLPTLPATLPAEGDAVIQIGGNDLATLFQTPGNAVRIRRHIATVAAGIGLDGDTTAFHAVLVPVPGSQLDAFLRDCGTIPSFTDWIDLPGSVAFFAEGAVPDLRGIFPAACANPVAAALERCTAKRPCAATLFPPATPSGLPRALFFTGINDLAAVRTALLDVLAHHEDAISVSTRRQPLRGEPLPAGQTDAVSAASDTLELTFSVPIDTLSVASTDALAALLSRFISDASPSAFLGALADANPTLTLAWVAPFGLLAAVNDADATLLDGAISNIILALHATTFSRDPLPFEETHAFRAAFPGPDAPAHAIAHLDFAPLASVRSLPSPLDLSDAGSLKLAVLAYACSLLRYFDLPDPCPVDFFSCVAENGSVVLRLRAPANLVRGMVESAMAVAAIAEDMASRRAGKPGMDAR
jgi:hypothetical protein